MSNNRFGKYLTYALGEIVLIVVGILIALEIDNWNQDRQNRALELTHMHSLVEDLEKDITESRKVLENLYATVEVTNSVIAALTSPDIVSDSNDAYRLWSANLGFADFISDDRTVQRLKSDGGYTLIRFDAIVDAIIDYDQSVQLFYIQQEICNEYLLLQEPFQKMFDAIRILEDPDKPVPLSENSVNMLGQAYANRQTWALALNELIERLERVNQEARDAVELIRDHYNI